MPTELLIAEIANAISPAISPLLQVGINAIIEAFPKGMNLGMCEIHGSQATCSEVHLLRYGGQPSNREHFKLSAIKAGGFVWKLYLRNSGIWFHKLGGTAGAKVFEGEMYIHGPLCWHDSSHTRFKLTRTLFKRRWICEQCSTVISYHAQDKVSKSIAKQLRNKLLVEFNL